MSLLLLLKNPSGGTTLNELAGALTIMENSANGTVVGTPSGFTEGSTKDIIDSAAGRFTIHPTTGTITVSNSTLLDYEDSSGHYITVRETLAGAVNSPRDTVLYIFLDDDPFEQQGDPYNLTIDENELLLHDIGTSLFGFPPYEIVGGVDATQFQLIPQGGSTYLQFSGSPSRDYENPQDFNLDNVYVVELNDSSGFNFPTQYTVTIANITETGITLYKGIKSRPGIYKGIKSDSLLYKGTGTIFAAV